MTWGMRGRNFTFLVAALGMGLFLGLPLMDLGLAESQANITPNGTHWKPENYRLEVVWSSSEQESQPIRTYYLDEISQWKTNKKVERDPKTGQMVEWEGVLLNRLVEYAMRKLTVEQR